MHATKASGNPAARIFFASLSASPRPPFPRHQERPNTVVVDGGIEAQIVFFCLLPVPPDVLHSPTYISTALRAVRTYYVRLHTLSMQPSISVFEMMVCPSQLIAQRSTVSSCPSSVAVQVLVATSHSFSVLSRLQDSTRSPAGENAQSSTPPVWPVKVRTCA